MAKWTKPTPYGDYRDPLQNHKFDNQLILNPNTKKLEVYNKLGNILHEVKWYFGKHIGSKKLSRVKAVNRMTNTKRHLIKNYIDSNKESKENTSEN